MHILGTEKIVFKDVVCEESLFFSKKTDASDSASDSSYILSYKTNLCIAIYIEISDR